MAAHGRLTIVGEVAAGRHPLSRPLFVYVKLASLKRRPEIAGLLALLLSEEMIGDSGELTKIGLILSSAEIRQQNRLRMASQERMDCPSAFCGTALQR
jgi:hypothetical protein